MEPGFDANPFKEIVVAYVVPQSDIPELKAMRACGRDWKNLIDNHIVWKIIAGKIRCPYSEDKKGYETVKSFFCDLSKFYCLNLSEIKIFFKNPTVEGLDAVKTLWEKNFSYVFAMEALYSEGEPPPRNYADGRLNRKRDLSPPRFAGEEEEEPKSKRRK